MSKTSTHFLRNKRILITAGPTWEMLDPVRFLSNRSSGQMGFEIAKAAAKAGAKVTLIMGPASNRYRLPVALHRQQVTGTCCVVSVVSAREMYRECLKRFPKADIIIMTAAVSDYRPVAIAQQKIKKGPKTMTLTLIRNPDILATLGKRKKRRQLLVGFALESHDLLKYAQDKLRRKNCDLIVANPVPTLGAATNTATLLYKGGRVLKLQKLTKSRLAQYLVTHLVPRE